MQVKRSNQEYLLLLICSCAIICILPLFIYYFTHEYGRAVFDVVITFSYLLIFLNVFLYKEVKRSQFYLLLLTIVCIIYTASLANHQHLYVYWMFPVSIILFYIYSCNISLSISFVLMAVVIFITCDYLDADNLLTFITTYFIINVFSYFYSQKIHKQQKSLKENAMLTGLINNILEMIVNAKPLDSILHSITKSVDAQFPEMLTSILLVDSDDNVLVLKSAPSLPEFYNKQIARLAIKDEAGSCCTAAYRGERVIVEDVSTHQYWADYVEITKTAGLLSCWSEPIKNSYGEVLGTFAIYKRAKSSPSSKEIKLLEQFAHLASIAIEKDRANTLILQQANFDSLTQLPNRNSVFKQLSTAIEKSQRQQSKLLVAFIDLDNFKQVNDTYGHSFGDKLLVNAAQRISKNIRKGDFVARLGGDEFIILCEDFTDTQIVDHFSQPLLKVLSAPYRIEEQEIHISASIGIAIYPDNAANINGLLNNADQAMYQAKRTGKNAFCIYSDEK